ncbi:MAG: serine hydrolase [Elusimicrobia bacterium]|nr:serine hydrolase [Elusimicrobiota bacterium]
MRRLIAERKIGWDALRARGADFLFVSALIVVGLSYGLGYRLDWSEESGRVAPTEDVEVAQIPAPASLPGASAPREGAPPAAATIGEAPGPAIAPAPADAAWDKMTSRLDELCARYPGRVSVYLKDLRTGRTWTRNPDDLYPAASLIKLPIIISTFYRMRDGGLSLDDTLTLTRSSRVGGSGSLKWYPDGSKFTVRQLLIHMVTESDNTATKMILDRLGLGYVQQQFPRMGLLYTGIYASGMSLRSGRVEHENYTTAREMEMLLEKIYRGQAVDKASSALMLDILKMPHEGISRLAKGLPPGWEIAHKTGLERRACHDAAIFFTPNGDYAMVVLTGQNRSYKEAKEFITRLGHVTFADYAGPKYLAERANRRRRRF